jgi:hypothetical protein
MPRLENDLRTKREKGKILLQSQVVLSLKLQ